jgi:hypothetical protein
MWFINQLITGGAHIVVLFIIEYGCFHQWGIPKAGWFIKEHPKEKRMI